MKFKKSFFIFVSTVLSLGLWVACKDKTAPQNRASVDDYPVMNIVDSMPVNELSLHALSEDFIKDFLMQMDNYQGTKRIMDYEIPQKWGLVCLERLPQGRELWLIQSEDREWTYLVTTSGSGTQRVLDLVPIDLNLARFQNKEIEQERWVWHRDEDGAFLVDKYYRWTKSLEDSVLRDSNDYKKSNYVCDKYIVNDMGRFDCYPNIKTDTSAYRAVICYSGAHPSDEWAETVEYLEAFCEDYQLLFSYVNQSYHHAVIQDYRLNPVDTLDITPYLEKDSVGMLLFENGIIVNHFGNRSMNYLEMEVRKNFKRVNQ